MPERGVEKTSKKTAQGYPPEALLMALFFQQIQ
jgi:hypothetical protein